jgi:hypothetical protein
MVQVLLTHRPMRMVCVFAILGARYNVATDLVEPVCVVGACHHRGIETVITARITDDTIEDLLTIGQMLDLELKLCQSVTAAHRRTPFAKCFVGLPSCVAQGADD